MGRTSLALAGVGCIVLAGGCARDSRISLAEFIVLQHEFDRNAAAQEVVDQAVEIIETGWQPYKLGPGDTLVVKLSGLNAAVVPEVTALVDRDGAIDLPLIGKVSVGEREVEDVERDIEAAYVPSTVRDLSVHVELLSYETTEVTVVGAVLQPGFVPLSRHQRNLLFAIVAAGGVSSQASGEVRLQRLRRPAEEVSLNLLDPYELQAALALNPLEDGDIITVEAAPANTIFVGGLVNGPAPQSYPPGTQINILQAIAAAGGLRTDISPKEGTLIRRMPNGADVRVKLNLDRLERGADDNIMLAAGDILWVPHTWETRVQDFINRNFFLRAGVSANVSYNVTGIEYLNRQPQQAARTAGGGGVGGLEDRFDPFGFLNRNAALQGLQGR